MGAPDLRPLRPLSLCWALPLEPVWGIGGSAAEGAPIYPVIFQ